jgi:hypothetical protein
MKRLLLILVLLLSLALTGCMQKYTITDEKSDAMAEYMAGLLLENDKNYNQDLIPMDDIKADEAAQDSGTSKEDAGTSDTAPTKTPGNDTDSAADNADTKENYSLNEVIGVKNFDIKFKAYKLTDTYPEKPESAYFSLSPRHGYQLLVVSFSVENTSAKTKTFDLSSKDIIYQLNINSGTIYKPQFTLLVNDLKYINIKIKGGATKEAVLAFEVSKDIDLSGNSLDVTYSDKSTTIEVK